MCHCILFLHATSTRNIAGQYRGKVGHVGTDQWYKYVQVVLVLVGLTDGLDLTCTSTGDSAILFDGAKIAGQNLNLNVSEPVGQVRVAGARSPHRGGSVNDALQNYKRLCKMPCNLSVEEGDGRRVRLARQPLLGHLTLVPCNFSVDEEDSTVRTG